MEGIRKPSLADKWRQSRRVGGGSGGGHVDASTWDRRSSAWAWLDARGCTTCARKWGARRFSCQRGPTWGRESDKMQGGKKCRLASINANECDVRENKQVTSCDLANLSSRTIRARWVNGISIDRRARARTELDAVYTSMFARHGATNLESTHRAFVRECLQRSEWIGKFAMGKLHNFHHMNLRSAQHKHSHGIDLGFRPRRWSKWIILCIRNVQTS